MIAPQDFASYSSSACGVFMVIGSMVLLYKGVISLAEKAGEEALSVEFKNHIKLTSHYPAIALFIMGWVCLFIPMLLPDNSGPSEVKISGKVGINPTADLQGVTVRIFGGPWDMSIDSDGSLNKSIFPNLSTMTVEISAPGRPKVTKTVSVDKSGAIFLGDVTMASSVSMIYAMPTTTALKPINVDSLPAVEVSGEPNF